MNITTFENADTEPKSLDIYADFVGERTLHRSDPANLGAFSRFSFFFTNRIPSYDAQYVDVPIACGSGAPVEVAGEAFIEITFSPARAHNNDGESTHFLSPDDADGMPSIVDVVQTCDFEGQLTFVFGLNEELPYRLNYLTQIGQRETIAIDVGNP